MDHYTLAPLPPLIDSSLTLPSNELPEFPPLFKLSPLEDCPQNPILDSLVRAQKPQREWKPKELERVRNLEAGEGEENEAQEDIWLDKRVINNDKGRQNQILSWDALRPGYTKHAIPTPFLSEQSGEVFDAVRQYVRPHIVDPFTKLCYVRPNELLRQLMVNIVGNSSLLYVWDEQQATLVPRADEHDTKLSVIVEGLDETSSKGVIQRFLNIGTLLRRLENLLRVQRKRVCNATMHAFLHAITTVLSRLRNSLADTPPFPASHLVSLSFYYSNKERLLVALAKLCYCDQSPLFKSLPSSASMLLSHVYSNLCYHVEHASPKDIIASLAYILTISSRDYFVKLGHSLGLVDKTTSMWLRPNTAMRIVTTDHLFPAPGLNDISFQNHIIEVADEDDQDYSDLPIFFDQHLIKALPAARKSLTILQAAGVADVLQSSQACEWFWSYKDLEKLWQYQIPQKDHASGLMTHMPSINSNKASHIETDLEGLARFDLEPSTDVSRMAQEISAESELSKFIEEFPSTLHRLTPTLGHLSCLILRPLAMQADFLSNSVLMLYMRKLRLDKHLLLLRSFMLATLSGFKRRLVQALFTDEYNSIERIKPTAKRKKQEVRVERDLGDSSISERGIGINPSLSEGDSWPPRGTDLNFSLRNVIYESLAEKPAGYGDEDDNVWLQGESRLGFSIRDLPMQDGKDRWLNSMTIEALDFLYLDYKPPPPLDVILDQEAMSKYHRIFTFLLRYFRIEMVMRLIYRAMLDESRGPLFPYSPTSQRVAQELRFRMQGFVVAFGSYVFDSVIFTNFDEFLRMLADIDKAANAGEWRSENGITSVFHLREMHSQMLNTILSGCLLRTSQATAGDVLRELFDTILQFGHLVTSLRQERIREAEAALELLKLNGLFHGQMYSFVRVLQDMLPEELSDERGLPEAYLHMLEYRRSKEDHLTELLTRIDGMRWWRRRGEEGQTRK